MPPFQFGCRGRYLKITPFPDTCSPAMPPPDEKKCDSLGSLFLEAATLRCCPSSCSKCREGSCYCGQESLWRWVRIMTKISIVGITKPNSFWYWPAEHTCSVWEKEENSGSSRYHLKVLDFTKVSCSSKSCHCYNPPNVIFPGNILHCSLLS